MKTTHQNTLIECAGKFSTLTAEGPVYACCCCFRLLFKASAVDMKPQKYNRNAAVGPILDRAAEQSWICRTCLTAVKAGRLPTQSWANSLELQEIPPELKDLRPLELRLISQRIPFSGMLTF